ncbi:MAG TPA: peptidylprolyl isomerase [Candidatus Binatia bacterium]|nr:peptidylprolyl isomerase [Candidatus Binatia bacterium]
MNIKDLSHKQIVTYSVSAVLILFALSLVLAYFTPFRDPVSVAFKRLYPAALIGDRVVSVNDIEEGMAIARRFNVSDAKASVIQNEKAFALAKEFNLNIDDDELADEMRFYTKGHEDEYQQLLENYYDGSEHWFYKYAVTPRVVDAALKMKYYNDIKANSPEYEKAMKALDRIQKGEKFEDIAKAESADKASGQIGGDLGFYEAGQLIPELEDQVSVSAVGDVRRDVIITRLGYHLIYPVEYSTIDGKKMWHLKHILYVPEGYEEWFSQQESRINTKFLKG